MTERELKRFLAKILIGDDCWIWQGAIDNKGYARLWVGSKTDGSARVARVSRLAYEHLVGPIPSGLQLDHLCRNRACVNPAHLEPVTNKVNVLRGIEARRLERSSLIYHETPEDPGPEAPPPPDDDDNGEAIS